MQIAAGKKEGNKCFLLLHLIFIQPIHTERIRVRKQKLLLQSFQPQGVI